MNDYTPHEYQERLTAYLARKRRQRCVRLALQTIAVAAMCAAVLTWGSL